MSRPEFGIAYFGNRYPGHAQVDLAAIAELGATTVVHTCSESDLHWNPGTMAELVAIGRAQGLSSWFTPWALGGVFGGESPSYVVMEAQDATQRDNYGSPLPALCINSAPFRELICTWLDLAAAAGASVVTWDEPHLALSHPMEPAGRWCCRCAICQRRFERRHDAPMPTVWNDEVAEFQRSSTLSALVWMIEEATRRGLQSGLILLPDEALGDAGWRTLASLPGVAWFGLTPYWIFQQVPPTEVEAYLRHWCTRMLDAISGLPVRTVGWIQAFSVPAGREAELARGIDIMEEMGIDLIAVWAFRACEAMSALTPDDPARVWATVESSLRGRRAST